MSAEPTGRRRCAVLGSPIGHSLSPVLHRAAYAALGLDWEYVARDVPADRLADVVGGLDDSWRGLSLTMPLKSAVVPLCTWLTPMAARLSSVNTLLLGPLAVREGHNTDVPGCVAALAEAGVDRVESALILGSGATAASVLAAVVSMGASQVEVVARSPEKAARLVTIGHDLGAEVRVAGWPEVRRAGQADLLVSTVPVSAQPEVADHLARLAPTVFDVVYAPARTPLLATAERAGALVVPGFALLLHQAARQVELMTGCAVAPLEQMRHAGLGALPAG